MKAATTPWSSTVSARTSSSPNWTSWPTDGAAFTAISEERGTVEFNGGGDSWVVIDPIDGSLNVRRTMPSHSLSIAIASAPNMAAVEFGYVYDFGPGEEFWAQTEKGAYLNERADQGRTRPKAWK